ncbi:hypothetical protein IQ35_02506 [Sphingobium wenxiniae]|jgi:hypothetical protein|nr:hypothetical protein IQ35_02506 [Sphingobium wenxiniae]
MWPWNEGKARMCAFPRAHHWLMAAGLLFFASQIVPVVAGLL